MNNHDEQNGMGNGQGAPDEKQGEVAQAKSELTDTTKQAASELTDTTKQAASELTETTKQAVSNLAADLKQSAAHSASELKETAKQSASQVKDTAAQSASTVAHAAADGVKAKGHDASQAVKETVAEKMYGTAERVRNRSTLPEAEVIDKVAEKIEASGDYVREHDVTEMKDDLAYRVREAPLLAVALSLFVGFLLGSILKRG